MSVCVISNQEHLDTVGDYNDILYNDLDFIQNGLLATITFYICIIANINKKVRV